MLVLRQAGPPDSNLSNNATFLWHWDQNEDENHRMKTELEDPGPKFFGHVRAPKPGSSTVRNGLWVPGRDLPEHAAALALSRHWNFSLRQRSMCSSPVEARLAPGAGVGKAPGPVAWDIPVC